ncbi:MAG TPA: proline--tRNA ligase [Myxococcota bacterium]
MRQSQMLIPTVKETPADAVVASHRLMLRAGMIRKLAAGIYTYLPVATRVFAKVANIVREEMNRAGAQEIIMPVVNPGELWQESGRWEKYGPELLRFKDRKGSDFILGPTHEETVTALVRDEVKSYRQLPLNLYQIQTKFRDEVRPRFGLMRGREFVMKDAYSFHVDEKDALREYDNMYAAYQRIFKRCGLQFRAVEADTGSIGGNRSHEFQVLAQSGEDAIAVAGDYAANVELAPIALVDAAAEAPTLASSIVDTPHKKTIEEVAGFLGVSVERVLKAVLFMHIDDDVSKAPAPILAVCRGDRDVNEIKLKRVLGGKGALRLMRDDEVLAHTGAPPGFAGPVDVKAGLRVVVDQHVQGLAGLVCGANSNDKHRVQVAVGRDLVVSEFGDLTSARAGDLCAKNNTAYEIVRGIEVGHVFFLGTKYSSAMKAVFQGEDKVEKPYVMGCYGIGVTRTAASAIEQNHDDDGIRWPAPIAPFHVSLVSLGVEPETTAAATKLYDQLVAANIEVLFDDRDLRAGEKFADSDLIGIPSRLIIGDKVLESGLIEVKDRKTGEIRELRVDELADALK